MEKVGVHSIPNYDYIKSVLNSYNKCYADDVAFLKEDKEPILDYIYIDNIKQFYISVIYLHDKQRAIKMMRLALKGLTAGFKIALNPEKKISLDIGEAEPLKTVGRYYTHAIDNYCLRMGILLSFILGDNESLAFFVNIPIELTDKATGQGLKYQRLYTEFWQMLFNTEEQHNAWKKLEEAFEAASPDVIRKEANEHIEELIDISLYREGMEMELMIYFLANKHVEFNQHLVEALQSYKKYWERTGDLKELMSYVSIPITAIACAAYHKGFPIEVQSDYMPRFLVERDFEGDRL